MLAPADTGATLTVMPGDLLDRLGVERLRRVSLVLADGRRAPRDVGEAGEAVLLGLTALEQRGVAVEPVQRRAKGRGFRHFSLRGLARVRGEFNPDTLLARAAGPGYNAVQGITPMTLLARYDSILAGLLAELRAAYGARLVACAVFGSVGRGTARHDSDVDFLIVARGLPRGRVNRVEEFLPVEDRLESALGSKGPGYALIALSPVFKSPEEVDAGSPLFLDLVEDARILYDPEGFLAARLNRLRARLRELGAQRIWRGNAWYWDLKPDLKPGEVFSL